MNLLPTGCAVRHLGPHPVNKAELEWQIWTRAAKQLDAIKNAARRTDDSTNRTDENPFVPRVDRRRTEPGPSSGSSSEDQIVGEDRSLLPIVLEKNKKPWHTRIKIIANWVRRGNGYHLNFQAFCLIEQGPDKGKDYVCSEFETMLDLGDIKSAPADMGRQVGR